MPGLSVSQGAVAHSTPEAEIIAAATAMRKVGIPAMVIWRTSTIVVGQVTETRLALVASVAVPAATADAKTPS